MTCRCTHTCLGLFKNKKKRANGRKEGELKTETKKETTKRTQKESKNEHLHKIGCVGPGPISGGKSRPGFFVFVVLFVFWPFFVCAFLCVGYITRLNLVYTIQDLHIFIPQHSKLALNTNNQFMCLFRFLGCSGRTRRSRYILLHDSYLDYVLHDSYLDYVLHDDYLHMFTCATWLWLHPFAYQILHSSCSILYINIARVIRVTRVPNMYNRPKQSDLLHIATNVRS